MRYRNYLRQRYRTLLGYAGELIFMIGILNILPLGLLLFYPQEVSLASSFLITGLPLVGLGWFLWKRVLPKEPEQISISDGSVIVVIVWATAILSGTIPFMLITQLDFTHAFFEATSGWTGIGVAIIDIEAAPRLLLFFRSFIQLAGGAGFAIIALNTVAGLGVGVVAAEGRTDQFAPHVRQSASIVLKIYAGYNVFGILALRLAGMSWFDAVNHSFTAISAGGFSTRAKSIGYWDSPVIEGVIIVLMLLGATNFYIAYTFLRGKFGSALRSGEVRVMFFVLMASIIPMFFLVTNKLYPSVDFAVRVAVFESVSAMTSTGFSLIDYRTLPDFGGLVIIILTLIGGSTGSTAAGIKLMRLYVLYKAVIWEVKRAFMPKHMVNEPAIWHGEKRELLNDKLVRQVALFIALYLTFFIVGAGLMMAHGYTMYEALFEFASSLSSGMSVGVTTQATPPLILWSQALAMILGRLEFIVVIVGVVKLISDGRIMLGLQPKEL